MHTTIDLAPATSVLGRRTRGHFEQSYETQHGRPSGKGLYSESDWRRLDYMLSLMPAGGTVLDVGIGPGAFVQMLALSGRFDRVCGIDIRRSSKFVELCEFDFRKMTVERMSFEDDEFDTVVCMEVLEHVPMEVFGPALQELRRVAAKELLMTVPSRSLSRFRAITSCDSKMPTSTSTSRRPREHCSRKHTQKACHGCSCASAWVEAASRSQSVLTTEKAGLCPAFLWSDSVAPRGDRRRAGK